MPDDRSGISPPVVPPEHYTESYYTTCCAGHEEWTRSGGAESAGSYLGFLRLAGLQPGEVLVDIGTGRGELLAVAVEGGAERAIGVEYAEPAVALARETIARRGAGHRAEVLLGDARRIALDDATADLVTMLDVAEHLAPHELSAVFAEAHRLLRPGGRLFVHTMPNRLIYDVTYRWQRRRPGRRRWPADPRNEMERLLHVNEQTRRSLRRALRAAGFPTVDVAHGQWIYTDFVPDESARILYHRLARFAPTRALGAANLVATARRAAT